MNYPSADGPKPTAKQVRILIPDHRVSPGLRAGQVVSVREWRRTSSMGERPNTWAPRVTGAPTTLTLTTWEFLTPEGKEANSPVDPVAKQRTEAAERLERASVSLRDRTNNLKAIMAQHDSDLLTIQREVERLRSDLEKAKARANVADVLRTELEERRAQVKALSAVIGTQSESLLGGKVVVLPVDVAIKVTEKLKRSERTVLAKDANDNARDALRLLTPFWPSARPTLISMRDPVADMSIAPPGDYAGGTPAPTHKKVRVTRAFAFGPDIHFIATRMPFDVVGWTWNPDDMNWHPIIRLNADQHPDDVRTEAVPTGSWEPVS